MKIRIFEIAFYKYFEGEIYMTNIGSTWNKWDLHVHTASSYDAKYKGKDYDVKLVKAWSDYGIKAAAITDHGIIDASRIENIRKIIKDKGLNITVFPGVELRTDTASPNLHVIGIFSEKMDLHELSEDFRAFSRQYGLTDHPQTAYVSLTNIVQFVREQHHGLISVHDGKKSNGLGKAAGLSGSKDDPNHEFKTLLRHNFRSQVDFLDTNSQQSAELLVKYTCCGNLKDLPVTVNSDIHTPRAYTSRSVTWMKAELTFDGLKEAFSQPAGRISFKVKPEDLQSQEMRRHETISKVLVRSETNQNDWYGKSLRLELNPGLVTIIGNKGSGKSALVDVIGLDGNSSNMDYASFLSKNRFNNRSKYGSRFSSCLWWGDGSQDDWIRLDKKTNLRNNRVEFLPQSFIEKIASSVEETELTAEIKKIVFSALPINKRLGQQSWEKLTDKIEQDNNGRISDARNRMHDLNASIFALEEKFKSNFLEKKREQLDEIKARIRSLKNNPPKKPIIENKQLDQYERHEVLSKELDQYKQAKSKAQIEQANLDKFNLDLNELQNNFNQLIKKIDGYNINVKTFIDEYSVSLPQIIKNEQLLDSLKISMTMSRDRLAIIKKHTEAINAKKCKLQEKIDCLSKKITLSTKTIKQLDSKMTLQNRKKAQYSDNLKKWKSKISSLQIGSQGSDSPSEKSLKAEIKEVTKKDPAKIKELYLQRNRLVGTILELIKDKGHRLDDLYLDAKQGIYVLNQVDQQSSSDSEGTRGVEFVSSIQPIIGYIEELVGNIDSRKAGKLKGSHEAANFIKTQLDDVDLSVRDEVISFIETILYQNKDQSILDKLPDLDSLNGVFRNRKAAYDYLYGLQFLDAELHLTYNNRPLQALSAGERGLVLLIFYLGLSQKELPLVIDQPEDNLDNQSIFKHLVPYLRYAKTKRQIIVVTHNPNIAIAADADQVIVATMDKKNNIFNYESGALEEANINQQIVDVLEGTKPAFNLRDKRYSIFD